MGLDMSRKLRIQVLNQRRNSLDASIKPILSVIKSATESISDFSEQMSEAEESISLNLIQVFFLDSR